MRERREVSTFEIDMRGELPVFLKRRRFYFVALSEEGSHEPPRCVRESISVVLNW